MSDPDWYYDDMVQVGLDFNQDSQVATYDERQTHSPEDERGILSRLALQGDCMMADIGCGTGVLVCQAAATAKHVLAVDISPAMLKSVTKRAAALGRRNVTTINAGFLSWNAEPASLD